ncbi:MAG: Spi family protease inhibitor [Lentisphaerae bacterium]|nr:Spi family protease inhibitor [Lentisphaerota bacterium]
MKTILLYSLFLLFSCLAPLSIFAAPVDEATAKSAALGWLNHTRGIGLSAKLNPDIESMDSFKDDAGDVLYYVINLKPDGYVVVSADDQIEPIITFSQTGSYDPNPENPLYVLLNKDMTGRNNYVKKELPSALKMAQPLNQADKPANVTHAEKSQEKWTLFLSKQTVKASSPTIYGASPMPTIPDNDIRVDKLVQSKWSQSNVAGNPCYNYYTPNHYVCGCVATAMAQLMRFHGHPVSGIGVHPFTVKVDGQWIGN